MQKKDYHIKLVGFPYFFNYISEDEENELSIDFNKIFWNLIFSKEILNYINFSKLDKKDLLFLKYLLKNLELSKEIFLLLKRKDISIYNVFFAFNIINSLIIFINRNLTHEEIYFYGYFKYSKETKDNLDKTFIYNFFLKNKELILKIPDNSTLNIKISLSEQLIQLEIIKTILLEFQKNISLNIDLTSLREFENKLDLKKIINEIFSNTNLTVNIDFLSNSQKNTPNQIILGHKNIYKYIFNKGCSYRKCVFCNIGKFLPKVNSEVDEILKELVEANKNGDFQTLHIADPDIQPNEILYICEFFSKHNADLKIHIRTRFSKNYTLDVLEKIYKGGVRFMGVGLESASPRINKLMDKYDYDVTMSDFDILIENCFKVGINVHNYTIFGFPTETKEEIDLTKSFLLKNLNKYDFFTFTPGIFGINKGTYIFNNPEKFNLKFDKSNIGNKIFIKEFYEENISNNKDYLFETLLNLNASMFFGDGFIYNYSYKFWDFIEHSGLLHMYKMIYKKNPFLNFWNLNESINKENYLNNYYNLTKYYQVLNSNGEIFLKNRINLIIVKINNNILNLFSNYDSRETLGTNMLRNDFSDDDFDLAFELIKNYFFILKPKSEFELIYEKYLGISFYEREINYLREKILRKDNVYEILVKNYFYEENIYKEILVSLEKMELKTSTEVAFLSYIYALNYKWENAISKMEEVIILENGENIDSFIDFGHFLRKIPEYENISIELLLNIESYMEIYQKELLENKKISLIEILYG